MFRIRLLPKERAEDLWPEEKGRFGPDPLAPAFGPALPADRTKTVLLLEYCWKERGPGGDRVHMALFGGGRLLFDSREKNPGGVAPDREYPFAVTVMLPREGSSLGLGFGDSFGPAQIHTDLLDGILLRNMVLSSRNKLLVTDASGFDANDLADWTREVHRGDSLTGVTWFSTPALPAYIAEYARQLRQSAREESGANDFTRGNATGGVTAASAIAALQEAGGKRSRMLARRLQESFREAVRREIEYERARGILPRSVRLRGPGGAVTGSALFDPRCLVKPGLTGPVPAEFFLSVRVSRERRFDVDAHNQLMLTLKDKGMATPMAALRRMRFDGRDELVEEMERTAGEASPA